MTAKLIMQLERMLVAASSKLSTNNSLRAKYSNSATTITLYFYAKYKKLKNEI